MTEAEQQAALRRALDAIDGSLAAAIPVLEAAAELGELHEWLGSMAMGGLDSPDDIEPLFAAARRLGWKPDPKRPIV